MLLLRFFVLWDAIQYHLLFWSELKSAFIDSDFPSSKLNNCYQQLNQVFLSLLDGILLI